MLSPLCALLYPGVRVIQMASITVSCETWQTCETCGKGGTRSLRRSCSGQDVLFGPPCATRWKLRAFPHTARNFLKTSSWRQQRYKSRNHHLTKKLHGFALLQKNSTALLWVSVPVEDRFSRSACFTRSGPDHNLLEQVLNISECRKCLKFRAHLMQFSTLWHDLTSQYWNRTKILSFVLSSARASWAPRSRKALWNLKVAFISSLVQPSPALLFGPIATDCNQDANKKIEQEGW